MNKRNRDRTKRRVAKRLAKPRSQPELAASAEVWGMLTGEDVCPLLPCFKRAVVSKHPIIQQVCRDITLAVRAGQSKTATAPLDMNGMYKAAPLDMNGMYKAAGSTYRIWHAGMETVKRVVPGLRYGTSGDRYHGVHVYTFCITWDREFTREWRDK